MLGSIIFLEALIDAHNYVFSDVNHWKIKFILPSDQEQTMWIVITAVEIYFLLMHLSSESSVEKWHVSQRSVYGNI